MCTAIVLYRLFRDRPLVIAANRDEFYNRPASAPRLLSESPRIVCGVDEKKGGTWFGVTNGGFVALLTNQAPQDPKAPALSRGDIVMRVLHLADHQAATEYLASLDMAGYRGFNLLFGDLDALSVAYGREGSPAIEFEEVKPGRHVLPNSRLDDPKSVKVAHARAAVPAVPASYEEFNKKALAALQNHDTPAGPLSAICVHTPFYGTVSAQLVALSNQGVAEHLYAAGPLCRHQPVDIQKLHST